MTTGKGDLAWALSWYRRTWPYKNFYFGDLNQARSMVSWDHVRKPAQKRRPFPMTTKTAAQRGTAVSVKSLAITAICLVLVYVFTAVVNIRLPFAPQWRAHPSGERPPLRGRHSLWQAHRHDRRGASAWRCLICSPAGPCGPPSPW